MDSTQISKLLTEDYAVNILSAAYREPVSTYDLCKMFDIPVLRCFSVVRQLADSGLLTVVSSVPQANGNFRQYYSSSVKSATITIEDGKLNVHVNWDHGEALDSENDQIAEETTEKPMLRALMDQF